MYSFKRFIIDSPNLIVLIDNSVFVVFSSITPLTTFNDFVMLIILVSKSISDHLNAQISLLLAPESNAGTISALYLRDSLSRTSNNRDLLEVIISDLTYVSGLNKWCYVCLIIDLFNREIIGYAAGKHKDASIVEKAIKSIKYDLNKISIFHSDRGGEFKNHTIEEILTKFDIKRSLSHKGTPYDNAVVEATYKIFKTEFCFNKVFDSFEQLELELFDYVN